MKCYTTIDAKDFELAAEIIAQAIACEDDANERQKKRRALLVVTAMANGLRRAGSVTVSIPKK